MSSKPPIGPIQKAWFAWKSLRLPWRKRFFVGQDPSGNTYYELRQPRGDAPQSSPYRRLVHYPRSTPYSEVRVPPAWHQWLRHQRGAPPSMEEQITELRRQARMKVLAAEADARWAAKPSLLDMPGPVPPAPPAPPTPPTIDAKAKNAEALAREKEQAQEERQEKRPQQTQRERTREDNIPGKQRRGGGGGGGGGGPQAEPAPTSNSSSSSSADPWKRAQRGAPGETWQPEAWTRTPARKR